jgi:diguanylate cyclase (GGDEF)-like protein/PAS domain S-box-containing protein
MRAHAPLAGLPCSVHLCTKQQGNHVNSGRDTGAGAQRPHGPSLRVLVATASALLTVALACVLGWAVHQAATRALIQSIGGNLAVLATEVQTRLDHELSLQQHALRLHAPLLSQDEPSRLRARLDELQAMHPNWLWVGFAEANGRVVAASRGMLEGVDVSQREWFTQGLKGSYIGDLHPAALLPGLLPPGADGAPLRVIDLALPVPGGAQQHVGVLAAHLSESWMEQVAQGVRSDHTPLEIVILGRDGAVLVGPRALREQPAEALLGLMRGDADIWSGPWPGGESYLTGEASRDGNPLIAQLGWTVLVRAPQEAALAPVHQLQRVILGWGVVLVLLFAVLGWMAAGWISEPLRSLASAADRLRLGGNSSPVPAGLHGREISSLSAALNVLIATLQEREAGLRESEERLRVAVESARLGTWKADLLTGALQASRRHCELHGLNHGGLLTVSELRAVVDVGDLQAFDEVRQRVSAGGEYIELEYRVRLPDGGRRWVTARGRAQSDAAGRLTALVGVSWDTTAQHQAEQRLADQEMRLQLALAAGKMGAWEWDLVTGRATWTDTEFRLLGLDPAQTEASGELFLDKVHPDDNAELRERIDLALSGVAEFDTEFRIIRVDGAVRWLAARGVVRRDETGAPRRMTGVNWDITDRKLAEDRIRELAYHDPLTALANRRLLLDRLGVALAQSARRGTRLAVLMLDVDDFKDVNDSLGHPVGDQALREIARRLSERLRSSDTLARLGGDEFAIVQLDLVSADGAATLAQELIEALQHPIGTEDTELHLTATIGIALYPDDAMTADELLRRADLALYRAKQHARGGYSLFELGMDIEIRARKTLENQLRRAIERDEITVAYQPQFDLRTGRVVGVEALARWQHHEQGEIGPAEFIPVAEASGLIGPLGDLVLRTACREARGWQLAGFAVAVAVNISPVHLRQRDLVATVDQVLAESGLPPHLLELEITESTLLELASADARNLHELTGRGVRLAIDDFGTGYSSLHALRHLPASVLKIDRSFVAGLAHEAETRAVVRAIVTLAHALGRRVVAEGVETEVQHVILRELGCDAGQGFLLGRPRPGDTLASIMGTLPPAGASTTG